MSDVQFEQPETIERAPTPSPALAPKIHEVTLMNASLGWIMQVDVNTITPAGWHVCDGSVLNSADYPEFVEALGIKGATFTIPQGRRPETVKYIIKVAPSG